MDPTNLLIVERGADWTQWSATMHLVGHAMLVLVQQHDEPSVGFRRRIRERIRRLKGGLNAVVLLRARRKSRLSLRSLLRALSSERPRDVRVYPKLEVPHKRRADVWPEGSLGLFRGSAQEALGPAV